MADLDKDKLAKHAPEMVRLLLEMCTDPDGCRWCGEQGTYHLDPANLDCRLRDVLIDVGAIEPPNESGEKNG